MEGTGRKKWAVYTIRERSGLEKPIWLRVGIAFVNRDGSFSLYLDAQPLDGKLHMREWREEAPQHNESSNGIGRSHGAVATPLPLAAAEAAF
ncbi:hypothetical protein [Vulgatibacter sp.]|uniref:hypothetical protein n=1 Tax=Vulgatibacter sp. TaxID=1971226 RepID=UPI00356AEB49